MHYTQLRNIRLEDGRVRPVLFKQDHNGTLVPQYYPNLFIISKFNRNPSNTIKQVLLAIRCLMAWADREHIDIIARMRSFRFLQENELSNLKDALMLCYDRLAYEARRSFARREPSSSTKTVVIIPIRNVGNNTANIRIEYVAKYLKWLAEDKVNWLIKSEKDEVDPEIQRQDRWFKNNFFTVVESVPGKPLTKKQKELLEEVIKPNSTISIWDERPEHVRFRNRLILRTYWETGVRKSELMCFKLTDHRGDRTINLIKTPNDPKDPRIDKGKVKTFSRTLNISSSLDKMIADYILYHRQPARKGKRHQFIYTSQDGKPISVGSINNIFKKLRNIDGLDGVGPHDLRHDFATELRRRLTAVGLKDNVAEDYMRSALGWSAKSKMPALYTQEVTAEIIRQMSDERQERLEK